MANDSLDGNWAMKWPIPGEAALIREIYSDLLLIGNAMDARDLRMLYDHRIAAVVDLAMNEPPATLARDMIYCRFPLMDGDGNTGAVTETAIFSAMTLVRNRIRTLVACSAGMSRAPALGAAVIAVLTERNPDDCLIEIAAEASKDVSPILWSHVKLVYNQMVTRGDRGVRPTPAEHCREGEQD